MGGDLDIIKEGLLARAEDLCARLLPDGRPEGGRSRWMAHDPVAGDWKKTPALSVLLTGPRRGSWRAFRGTLGPAKHDLIGLIAYVQQTDTKGALAWARDFLGLKKMSAGDLRDMRAAADVARAQREKQAESDRARTLKRAQELFHSAARPLVGSDMAENYFAARRVPLHEIRTFAGGNFRFSPATEYWRGQEWKERRKIKSGPQFPAVHSALRGPSGVVTACHVTFLDPLKAAKAPVDPAKLMRGEAAGAVIEIARGATGADYWQTERPGDLILCEGIETGMALAIAVPEARVWAAGSITNMGNAPVQLPAIGRVFLARDNNEGNATAQEQLERVVDQLDRAGKPLAVMASHVGDDFNDLMQGE